MTQIFASAEVSDAIKTIYGDWGLGHFDNLAEERPSAPEAQLVADFQQDPCSQHTSFFRHMGLLEGFINYTAPKLIAEDGRISINQIGASGEEAWSLAILMNKADMPYSIAGYNVNYATLERAQGPFGTYLLALEGANATRLGMPLLEKCLEDTPVGVRPRPVITEHVTFNMHDILQGPVPGEEANTLVINNVLWHYPEETRGHIMANALAGLRPGGAFLFEGWTEDSRRTSGYADWVRDLDQYGLLPYHDRSVNSVLKYEPQGAKKVFKQSPAVNEALGVLAAVQEGQK